MKKYVFATLLCLFLLVLPLAAKGAREEAPVSAPKAERVITDHGGYEVTLPAEINRIVISSIFPLPSVYALFEGDASKLVGMHPSSLAAAKNSILPDIMPDIVDVSTDFVTNNSEINIEEILKLKPDVVFYSAANTAEGEKLRQAGIPAVGFSTTNWQFNTIETFGGWVEQLGLVLQQEDKAAGIVEYGKQELEEIRARFAAAGEIEKPRVMIIFRHANGKVRVSGSNFFGQFWIEESGGVNVAQELKGTPEVNMEQIYAWNPDIIYITNFTRVMPEDLTGNVIDGQDWSPIKAVQEGKVYKFPLGMYRWFPPASDTPLVFSWLAQHNHPELFQDIDMEAEVTSYYKRFYNIDLTEDQIYRIFHPSRDAADE